MTPGADNHRQEAILTIVGALNERELPPVKKHDISEHRLKYARQYAKVAGYDSDTFAKALLNIQDVAYKFVTTAPAGQMEPWMPEMASDDFGKCLVRTFPRKTGFHLPDTSIQLGYWESYLELKNDKPVVKDPASFRIGDIVELGFALIAYRTAQKEGAPRYICKLVMRTLTLLDTSLTKAAYIKRHTQSIGSLSKPAKRVLTASNPIAKTRKYYKEVNSDDDRHTF
ncbi:hypothetical protein B0H11DRAFT_1938646 [Mycena galericulata]|nr:hypothetical protein B0H11DRAFT_1938646 [Mycena galericulata]